MARPDPGRILREAQTIFAGNGETATLRAYVSGTTGAARFGVQDTFNYVSLMITGLFHSGPFGAPLSREQMLAGGVSQFNQLSVTTDSALGARDEILWRGSAYRVDGQGTPVHLGGRTQWRTPLVLAAATG